MPQVVSLYFFISPPEYLPQVFWILSSRLNTLRKTLSGHKTTICCSSSDAYEHTCTSRSTSHLQRGQHWFVFLQFMYMFIHRDDCVLLQVSHVVSWFTAKVVCLNATYRTIFVINSKSVKLLSLKFSDFISWRGSP